MTLGLHNVEVLHLFYFYGEHNYKDKTKNVKNNEIKKNSPNNSPNNRKLTIRRRWETKKVYSNSI